MKDQALSGSVVTKIKAIGAIADHLPAVVIILNIPKGFTVEYMSEKGHVNLGVSLQDIKSLGTDYLKKFFNPKDAEYYVPKLLELVERNDFDEVFTFFQQVKPLGSDKWQWYLSSMRLFCRDENQQPLLAIFHAVRIDEDFHLTKKVNSLLQENIFFRDNYVLYNSLSEREKDILLLIGKNMGNIMIADELFISVHTVETHKKNIKEKLGIKNSYELTKFAKAFNR